MANSVGPIAGAAIAAHPDENLVRGRTLFQRLLDGEPVETIIIARLFYRPVEEIGGPLGDSGAIAAQAIAAAPDELGGAGPDNHILVSDGPWCGRPDDVGIAHVEALPRLIDTGSHSEDAPYLPETSRRISQTTARLAAANGDRAFDNYFSRRTVDGLIGQVFLAEENGYARDWILLYEALQQAANPGLDECVWDLEGLETYLDVPVLTATFAGNGGASGDARLAGKYVPFAAGSCFNVEPDTESFADNIDRWHVGELIDVTVVKEGGNPFQWDGNNYETYSELKNAVVPNGYFTKALKLGRTKRGGEATRPITGDIVAPHGTTAGLLLALARGTALVPESQINAASFGALPDDPIDYFLKGEEQKLVSDVFDDLLRPLNGWYGLASDRRLSVGVIGFPESAQDVAFEIEESEIMPPGLDPEAFDEPPRWRLGVSGQRNWRPMTPDELVDYTENDNVSQHEWERLQRREEIARESDTTVRARHRGAIDALDKFGPTRGYFSTAAGARKAAAALFQFLRRPMRKAPLTLRGMKRLSVSPGVTGKLFHSALGLSEGKPAVCIGRRYLKSERGLELTLLVASDG